MSVVLAPVDGSARALHAVPWAALLAGSGGTVVLLRVVPTKPAYAEALLELAGEENGAESIAQAWDAVAATDLTAAADLLAGTGVEVERIFAAGEPDEAIVAAAERHGVDTIVMASHGRGAIGRAIFGSVADRVARSARVPVLILRAHDDDAAPTPDVRRIVVPLDGSEIAERALPVAARLARQLAVPVHVMRAVDPVTTMPVAPGVFGVAPTVTAEVGDRIWQEIEAQAQTTVRDAVAGLKADGLEASGALLHGSPFFAISEAMQPDDLLALTSHGRGGVGRWLLGSVAEKLVRESPAPVLLVPAAERNEGDGVMG